MLYEHSGIMTSYQVYGSRAGSPALLIHGLGADHAMWREQIADLTSAGMYLIVPDMLAHGKSSKVRSLTLDDWSNQIDALVDGLKVDTFVLVGLSMGGVIAQHYVVGHPQRVRGLILSDTFSDLSTLVERLMAFSQTVALPAFKLLGSRALASMTASAYKQEYARKARDYLYDVTAEADVAQIVLARRAINTIRVLDRLHEVRCPSLVIVGDQFGKTFVDINRRIADHLPDSRFELLHDSMDPSCLVQPERFNRIVLDFLASHGLDATAR